MERLTKRSEDTNSTMLWFVDKEKWGMRYEPCEMDSHQVREVLCKLAEYEDAEEDGLLKRLPCKVGDALYMPWEYDWNTGIAIITVKKIVIDWEDCFYVETDLYSDSEAFWEEYNYGKFSFSDFGKTVFLTKAEAEQALAKMKGET